MNIYLDRHTKYFFIFLFFYVLVLFGSSMYLCLSQTGEIRDMFLLHDNAIATSLLEQGVSEEIIATALTNTKSEQNGIELLANLGISQNTSIVFLPFLFQLQKKAIVSVSITIFLLTAWLFTGSIYFFYRQEKLFQHATNILRHYINGNYSCTLPHTQEGTIYQLFASVEQLATILQAKNETEHKAKMFLKNTISDISHQLKTPLSALSMYQEIIENESDNPAIVKEFNAKTGRALKRIEQLIQSTLKITRLDTGNIAFEKKSYCIAEVISYSLNELTTQATLENKEILLDGIVDEILNCDIEWTSEAIGNIVKNALDHTEANDVIRITWEHSPFMTRITITDTGKGIAPEDMPHIFKRFYRSKQSLNRQGIGLGLPLAKAIIEGQGGTISVQSELNNGTTFIISFLTDM